MRARCTTGNMADVTLAEFRARFPVFAAGTSNAAIETAIEEAHQLSDTSHDASLFCVAHLITLLAEETADLDGGSGVVSKETIGPRIVEYVTQAMTGARGVLWHVGLRAAHAGD